MVMKLPWKKKPRKLVDRDYSLMMVPERYRQATWERAEMSPEAVKALADYRGRLHDAWEKGLGLYIWGPLGSGKTSIAAMVLCELRSHGQPGLFARADKLQRSRFDKIHISEEHPDMWAYAREVRVLVVDDFGKSYRDDKGFSDYDFESLIRDRYDNMLVTIVTSNVAPSQFQGDFALKESTQSVLKASTVAVCVRGIDHREHEGKL